jgi:phage shock protein PspC (stress-responsive transcriptional regulator)
MSNYPPQQPPRKLERSSTNKVFGGVCGGVANYVNMDPTLVRVLTVLISLFTGVPVILYIIALFVIPEESSTSRTQSYPPVNGPQWNYGAHRQDGAPNGFSTSQPSYAPSPSPQAAPTPYGNRTPSASGEEAIWGTEGAPWEQRQNDPSSSSPASGLKSTPSDKGGSEEPNDNKL